VLENQLLLSIVIFNLFPYSAEMLGQSPAWRNLFLPVLYLFLIPNSGYYI